MDLIEKGTVIRPLSICSDLLPPTTIALPPESDDRNDCGYDRRNKRSEFEHGINCVHVRFSLVTPSEDADPAGAVGSDYRFRGGEDRWRACLGTTSVIQNEKA